MKKISKLLTLALIAGVGIFGSCKDVNEDMFQDMTQKSQNADGRIAALEKALGEAATQLITYKTALEAELAKKADITTLDEYAKKVTVDQINELLDQLELADPQKEAELLALVNGTAGSLEALTDVVTALDSDVNTLKTTTDNLKKAIDDNYAELSAEIIAANDLAQKAYDLAIADSMRNEEAMELAQSAFDLATENSEYIETLNEFMKNFNKNYKKFFDRELPKMQKTLAELEEKVFLFEFQMENLINPAIEDFRALEADYALVKADVELLQAQMAEVLNYLDRQITSIVNQGAFNRLFGYVSTPVGNANMLLALYSKDLKSAGKEFPMETAQYEKNDETGYLSAKDIQILKDGGLVAETIEAEAQDASAGQVFFTVNPVEANLEGTEFTLVNSTGAEVFELQNIVPASKTFHYGFDFSTRAGVEATASNGLYQADVILPSENIEEKAIHLGEILSEYKNILSQRPITSSSVKSLVSATVNFVNKTSRKFETNAIKALWSDSYYGNHSIYSAYEYGIAAVSPLSYGMFGDRTVSIAKFLQKINFEEQMQRLLNSGMDFNFDLGEITTEGLSENEDIAKLVAKINGALQKASENMSDQVTNQISDMVNGILDRLVNNRFAQFEITPNHMLLPVLFYADAAGDLHTLGTTKAEATLVEMADGDQLVKLVGSSLTAEMLAPAYKKFVGITNVYNAEHNAQEAGQFALKAAALDVNKVEGFDEVVDGSTIDFDFVVPQRNEAQKGYIYEITYSAMDYAGNTITNKYYIRLQ